MTLIPRVSIFALCLGLGVFSEIHDSAATRLKLDPRLCKVFLEGAIPPHSDIPGENEKWFARQIATREAGPQKESYKYVAGIHVTDSPAEIEYAYLPDTAEIPIVMNPFKGSSPLLEKGFLLEVFGLSDETSLVARKAKFFETGQKASAQAGAWNGQNEMLVFVITPLPNENSIDYVLRAEAILSELKAHPSDERKVWLSLQFPVTGLVGALLITEMALE